MRLFTFLVALLLYSISSFSQSPSFKKYTVDDGLPSNDVYHAIQDKKGYIWFATDNGVSRFDGYKFQNFNLQDGLPDNTIFSLYEDYKGRIWFVSNSCQLSYFYKDSIYKYQYNNKLDSLLYDYNLIFKQSFYVDSTDAITLGTVTQGIISISSYGNINIQANDTAILMLSKNNNVIIGRKIDVDKIDIDLDLIDIIRHDTVNLNVNNRIFTGRTYCVKSSSGNIYIATRNYLLSIDGENVECDTLSKEIVWVSEDVNSQLWIGFYKGGVHCYNREINKKSEHYLKGKSISSVLHDKEGGIWFTTLDGVFYTPSLNIVTYTEKDNLSDDNVNCVEKGENNKIWISTTNNFLQVLENRSIKKIAVGKDKSSIIYSLNYDSSNKILHFGGKYIFGYINNGNIKLVNNFVYKDMNIESSIKNHKINKVSRTSNNKTWLSTSVGVNKLFRDTVLYNSYRNSDKKINTKTLFVEDENTLWIGCKNGLLKYEDGDYIYYWKKSNLLKTRINDIVKDNNGNLWLASKGNGLLIMNADTIYQINKEKGLSDNSVTSIFVKDNVIWAGTKNGLNKITVNDIETEDYRIQKINKNNGLASNTINHVYVVDSLVYVSTDKGLSFFNSNKELENNTPPPVYITGIKVMENDTTLLPNYTLKYNKNSITINYVGLNYKNAGNITYNYILEGADNKWVTTKITYARYPSLPPGEYTFKVKAINEDGYVSKTSAEIKFTITPPYWETWWFAALVVLFSMLLIFFVFLLIYRIRIREHNKRIELKEKELIKRTELMQEINQTKQKALSQQMNPHFIFNTLNSIQYFIFQNDKVRSTDYLAKFARLMRITLDNSQEQTIPIQNEIDALSLYLELEALRFEGKFSYNIKVDDKINTEKYKIHTLLIQPYVENSILHGILNKGGNGKIVVELKLEENNILVIVEDDGVGRKRSREINNGKFKTHKSLGTKITESRLQLLNTLYGKEMKIVFIDLTDNNGSDSGTRVEIMIPIIKK